MNLIHRHIFLNVLGTCAAAASLFAAVLMAGNALRELIGPVLSGQLPFPVLLHLLSLMIPVTMSYALPMGMLTGTLLVLGRMSSDHEIVALRAAGLSVAWVSAPILFLALLGAAASLVINFQFMPAAKVAYETELRSLMRKNPVSFIAPQTFIRDFPGLVLYIEDMEGSRLKNLWLWEVDERGRIRRSIHAANGVVNYVESRGALELKLEGASAETRDPKSLEDFHVVPVTAAWDTATFDLPIGRSAGSPVLNKKLQWLTFSELMAERTRLSRPDPGSSPAEVEVQRMRVQIAIQEKFATAFSVVSFALVAVPLGIKASRRETSANLGMGLALIMAYYFATIVISWGDRHPQLRSDLLMWLPNIVLQALGFWLFFRIDRSAVRAAA